jgi:hypothetical protein
MSTPSVTMPTRMYSSGVFILFLLSLLEAFTALGEADEGQKRDNGYDNNKQIKHAVPPFLLNSRFSKLAASLSFIHYYTQP